MKKWLAPILILIFAALLLACGKQITQGIKNSEKADMPPSEHLESNTGQDVQFIHMVYDNLPKHRITPIPLKSAPEKTWSFHRHQPEQLLLSR